MGPVGADSVKSVLRLYFSNFFNRVCVCSSLTVVFLLFLPARRYASAGYRDRNVSVCLSVCPSVTRRYCVKTKKPIAA